jgi:hypothetical protein
MSWNKLESQSPEIAAFGKIRLHNKVAYLATVRKDGSPRVHPFTPIIGEGHFFVFMNLLLQKKAISSAMAALPFIVQYPIRAGRAANSLSWAGQNLSKTLNCARWQ